MSETDAQTPWKTESRRTHGGSQVSSASTDLSGSNNGDDDRRRFHRRGRPVLGHDNQQLYFLSIYFIWGAVGTGGTGVIGVLDWTRKQSKDARYHVGRYRRKSNGIDVLSRVCERMRDQGGGYGYPESSAEATAKKDGWTMAGYLAGHVMTRRPELRRPLWLICMRIHVRGEDRDQIRHIQD